MPVAFLGRHVRPGRLLAVSEEDGLLLSGDDDGVVCSWDTRTTRRRETRGLFRVPRRAPVSIAVVDEKERPARVAASVLVRGQTADASRARFAESNVARALEPRTLAFHSSNGLE